MSCGRFNSPPPPSCPSCPNVSCVPCVPNVRCVPCAQCPPCALPPMPPLSSMDVKYVNPEYLRKVWEEWDMRIIILYILYTQLYLQFFGRRRRKSAPHILINLNVWLLYLFAELLATISLGNLSSVKDDKKPMSLLRGLWAPIILFYLGGPDTITVLHLEENPMWKRHLIGLFTQGVRTSYVLYVTWTTSWLSVLALLMLLSGVIKYAERVWVIRSRVHRNPEGFIQLDDSTNCDQFNVPPNAKLVRRAYSYFQTIKPHISSYACDRNKLDNLIKDFQEWVGGFGTNMAFKLIEIELGFMYDVLFSKVDTIFTIWGCILRFISFSCTSCVLVGFFLVEKPIGHLEGDLPITIILLLGAIFLDIAGICTQLVSDWAIVWASKALTKQPLSKLVTPIFCLHELLNCKSKRWSELMGQFNLLNYWINKPTKFEEMMEALCGKEKMLNLKFSSPLSPIRPSLKEIIINHHREVLEVENLLTPTLKRAGWTLEKYECLQWSVELEFNESIIIWHIATDICYHSEADPNNLVTVEVEVAKRLSYYMMHLLVICPYRLPTCNKNDKFMQAQIDVKKFFEGRSMSSYARACNELLLEERQDSSNITVNNIRKLTNALKEMENKWKIVSNVWVEMLCYAASQCPIKHHVEELRHGGEFLTHIWLLLMHFGVTKKMDEDAPRDLEGTMNYAATNIAECIAGFGK